MKFSKLRGEFPRASALILPLVEPVLGTDCECHTPRDLDNYLSRFVKSLEELGFSFFSREVHRELPKQNDRTDLSCRVEYKGYKKPFCIAHRDYRAEKIKGIRTAFAIVEAKGSL